MKANASAIEAVLCSKKALSVISNVEQMKYNEALSSPYYNGFFLIFLMDSQTYLENYSIYSR